jgi:glutathione reductase (NADPH)
VPDIDELNLPVAHVAEDRRLVLNDYLQSVTNPMVYAAGDAASKGSPLTPVSSHDANVVAANILERNKHRPDYRGGRGWPSLPPIAAVGLSEAAARQQIQNVRVNSAKVPDWYTPLRVGEPVHGYKILIEEGGRRIDRGTPRQAACPRGDKPVRPRDPPRSQRRRSEISDVGLSNRASDIGYML